MGFWGEGSLAFLEAQNQKLKAVERCEAVAASSERLLQPAGQQAEGIVEAISLPRASTISGCSGLLVQQLGGDISPAACPITAGVQLGALVIAAPSLRNAWGLLVSDLFHKNT